MKKDIILPVFLALIFVFSITIYFSSTSYSKYDEEKAEIKYFYDELLRNNTIIDSVITKDKSLNYTNDAVGFYKEEETYFFRGNVENNYVLINNELWRIVSVLKDKSIRLIKEEGINNNKLYKYNEDYNNYTYEESIVKKELDQWHLEYFKNNGEYLVEEEYCILYENYCIEYDTLKVGLLSEIEVIYAGSYRNMNYEAVYLNNGYNWWISSKKYDEVIDSTFVGYMNELGNIDLGFLDEEMLIRPVINLKWNTPIVGNGTIDNPYIIEK